MMHHSTFPDLVFRDTVLAPLFEGVKARHRAHLVMLVEAGILTREDGTPSPAGYRGVRRVLRSLRAHRPP